MKNPSTVPPDEQQYGSGDVIDNKYRLVRRIGHGAMGVVWVAHNEVLQVHVAIKLMRLRREGPEPETLAARLLTEARAAAQLAHPAICRVFDFGKTEFGDPFVVQELLHGETLAEILDREHRLPALEAVQLLLPVVEGLSVAHGKGIVHRDVKPENIFVARDESARLQPKLLDFGIARLAEVDSKLTIAGTLLGTPDYMSPEQARGEEKIDQRSDVWGLCVVLYELITGHLPFERDNYNALLFAIANDPPPPITKYGAGDEHLWAVLDFALRKPVEERCATMRDFGVGLARWMYQNGTREDVCGASVRKNWLEASFAGDQKDLLSDRPPASMLGSMGEQATLPPSGVDQASRRDTENAPTEAIALMQRAHETETGTSLAPRPPDSSASPRRGRGIRVAVVAVLSVALGLGAGTVVLLSTSLGEWISGDGAAPAAGGPGSDSGDRSGAEPDAATSSTAAATTGPAGSASAAPSSGPAVKKPGAKRYVRPQPGKLKKPPVPKDDYEFGF